MRPSSPSPTGAAPWRRLIAPGALVTAMVLAAGASGHPDAVFPELGAISVGSWCLRRPAWRRHRWQLFWYPSATALLGVGVERWSGWSRAPAELVVGTLSVLVLAALDSPAVPALSAGLLPIVLGVTSLLYPLTVLVSTAVVAGLPLLATPAGIRRRRRARRRAVPATRQHWPRPVVVWFLLVFWAEVAVAAASGVPLLALPPIFVAAHGLLAARVRGAAARCADARRAAVATVELGLAAGVAVAARGLLEQRFVAAVVAFVLVAAFVVWRRISLEPMLPLALLPALLPASHLLTYLWAVPAEASLLGLLVVAAPLAAGPTGPGPGRGRTRPSDPGRGTLRSQGAGLGRSLRRRSSGAGAHLLRSGDPQGPAGWRRPSASPSRARVRSRPSTSSDSNRGGPTLRPVTARRTGS